MEIEITNEYGEKIETGKINMTPSNPTTTLSEEEKFFLKIFSTRSSILEMFSAKRIKTFFHYTSPSAVLKILTGSKERRNSAIIYFTRYDSLNDSEERRDILKFSREYWQEKLKKGIVSQSFIDMIDTIVLSDMKVIKIDMQAPEASLVGEIVSDGNYYFYEIECDAYLCCFSQEGDLLPMWNYYSKSNHYEGYSIGFDSKSFCKLESLGCGYELKICSVIYSAEEKEWIFDKCLLPIAQKYDTATQEDKIIMRNYISSFVSNFSLLFKNQAFEHEKEVRAILYIPKNCWGAIGDSISEVKYRDSNGYIVPYVEFICPENSVVSVKISPLLEKELAVKNMREYLSQMGYQDVKVDASNVPVRF